MTTTSATIQRSSHLKRTWRLEFFGADEYFSGATHSGSTGITGGLFTFRLSSTSSGRLKRGLSGVKNAQYSGLSTLFFLKL